MTPSLPIYLNSEIGYAMWWLEHPERGPNDDDSIAHRLLARGHVGTESVARQVVARAHLYLRAGALLRSAPKGVPAYQVLNNGGIRL